MDKSGYPKEHELKKIEQWDFHGFQGLMEYVEDLWKYPHCWAQVKNSFGYNEYHISTGGWSGNEDIITALQGNAMFWACCWMKSERGGHYVFEIRKVKDDNEEQTQTPN